jgi:hypothetical protein
MVTHVNGMAAKGRGTLPPYIPFRTFKTFLQDLEEHGVPGRIDKTVLRRFSGGVGRQLKTALRFLNLIDGDDHPTDGLKDLSGAYGGDGWPAALAALIGSHYAPVVTRLDLAHATPGQLREAFKEGFGVGAADDVLRKSELFFLQAVQEAQLPLSKRITVSSRQRSSGGGTRRRSLAPSDNAPAQVSKERPNGPDDDQTTTTSPPAAPERTPYQVLFEDIYDASSMTDDEEAAVFTLLRFLKRREKGMLDQERASDKDNGEPQD